MSIHQHRWFVRSGLHPFAIHQRMATGFHHLGTLHPSRMKMLCQPLRSMADILLVRWISAQAGDAKEFTELMSKSFCVLPRILAGLIARLRHTNLVHLLRKADPKLLFVLYLPGRHL